MRTNRYPDINNALSALPEWLRSDDNLTETKSYAFDHKKIGEAVRKRREAAKISLRGLAKWMSISGAYLSDMERGNCNWTEERIRAATEVLDMIERSSSTTKEESEES